MIQFTHEGTHYTVKPETAPKLRALLAKPKKHKPAAHAAIKRTFPQFVHGMTTAEYVTLFNSQMDNLFKPFPLSCENYHKPAPMLDGSIPECVEDENPDYLPEFLSTPTKKPAHTVATLKKSIREALSLIAAGDIDSAQCLLTEVSR